MTCDICERKFNYCFYINDEHWLKAVGKKEGHRCAHCILEQLGGLDWWIVENEPGKRSRESSESAEIERRARELGFNQFRADGWPLCPTCGEDELYSLKLIQWSGRGDRPSLRESIEEMRCYRCNDETKDIFISTVSCQKFG